MRRMIPLALAGMMMASPAAAQHDHAAAEDRGMATTEGLPDGWMMRFDRAGATPDMASFRVMEPGWHVTTGGRGAAIFWQPDMVGQGRYRVESTMHLMKPAQHAEAFGIFIGGEDLAAESQRYLYFLVRQNGQFLVKRRNGDETENIVGWTAHSAVPSAAAEGSTTYALAVEVGIETVSFFVNGVAVHVMPKSGLSTDGMAGLRINHMLDVHVERLALERML